MKYSKLYKVLVTVVPTTFGYSTFYLLYRRFSKISPFLKKTWRIPFAIVTIFIFFTIRGEVKEWKAVEGK